VPFESVAAVSYSPSTVTKAVTVAVSEIFSVKEWCDFENRVRVCSMLLEMAPFDRSHTILLAFHCNYGDILYRLRDRPYSELFVANRASFIPNLYLAPPQGVTPSKLREGVRY